MLILDTCSITVNTLRLDKETMAAKISLFCSTSNVYDEKIRSKATLNPLAQNNQNIIIFTTKKVDSPESKTFFAQPLHPSIKTVKFEAFFKKRSTTKR